MKLNHFKDIQFLPAIKALFKELKVPMNYVADEPTTAEEILKDTYKGNETFQLVNDVYFVGMIDDAAFDGNQSLDTRQIKSDYDGILVFGITLHQRQNNLLPSRSQLAEISRAFNREFYYTPVVLVFKYHNDEANFIAFANTERLKYKQAWREGEKAGKVSLLRDINIEKPHRGHEDIINQLRIPTSGTKAVDSFAKLFTYWQEVFSVSVLNKKFYQELSNWYFWALKHVTFPNMPTTETVVEKYGKFDQQKLDELIQEHNATNVIRLLTRLLFTWFIKEKKLIPEALFDLDALQKDILNEISPYHEEGTMFAQANKDSVYYKAILQNLFFASLNCPVEADGIDNRTRGFRGDGYGTHRGIDYLMRYKKYFKDPDAFLAMMNKTVPFLNGGLFECLDDKYKNLYIDGFSDQMTKGEQLVLPDYLFFGTVEEVDLSAEYGVDNTGTKKAAVKGLINILKSYKFTITENTPIEEDIALDPELLGKVFENLLASYNPETKTTARKQTGSFYTPREIVNYMVDESLIAYLKNAVSDWGIEEKELDEKLHQLTSFDPVNPFDQNADLSKRIVKALDECAILDPACGSGAFPMGTLQKMVHMLQKLDPQNEYWKDVQLNKALLETEEAYGIENKKEREQKLIEINNAFDEQINDPDYARKLYLIENCIYGVDIQPIATQISKLRFFISLVVDQKPTQNASDNFNIRPLPNLETKFVTANTLIGIERPKAGSSYNIFDTGKLKEYEKELKKIRHKLFSARTKDTKLKYRQKDEELRNAIAEELKLNGWPNDTAEKLAGWDPYDQNASSSFFDPEWVFDISEGFDVVIGNPPYGAKFSKTEKQYFKNNYNHQNYQPESFLLFVEKAFAIKSSDGVLSYIIPNTWLSNLRLVNIRKLIFEKSTLISIDHYHHSVFDAVVDTEVLILRNGYSRDNIFNVNVVTGTESHRLEQSQDFFKSKNGEPVNIFASTEVNELVEIINQNPVLSDLSNIFSGYKPYEVGKGIPKQSKEMLKKRIYDSDYQKDDTYRPVLRGSDFGKFKIKWEGNRWIKYGENLAAPRKPEIFSQPKIVLRQTGDQVIGVKDESNFVCPNNTHIIIPHKLDDIDYILAVLNSKISTFYLRYLNPEVGEALAEVKKETVSKIPIAIKRDIKAVSVMVKILERSNVKAFFNVLDAVIFNLYFSDHMKEQAIDVIEYVERDIAQALQGQDFEGLSESEKENVIEKLHATWRHPDNEVHNRMKLFAVRSPEILKPILES